MVSEFASIVGLLSAFASGKGAREQAEVSEFLEWLMQHNHSEIKDVIEKNQVTMIGIKSILNDNMENINGKLDGISNRMAILTSRSESICALSHAYASVSVSEQSLDLLTKMEECNTKYLLLSRQIGQHEQVLILSPGGNYICSETRFFHDDLNLMLSLGLLLESTNAKGEPLYHFTRAASELVKSLG